MSAAGSVGAADASTPDPVRVFYAGEPCDGDWIELEVFDRAAEAWMAHPEHPRVPVGTCQEENAGWLLNELRWRCVTPGGAAPWRNFQVFRPGALTRCAHEEILEAERRRIRDAERQRIRDAQRKHLELRPETE